MRKLKRIVALLAVTATLSNSGNVFGANQCDRNDCDECGYAYEGTRTASSISPLVALGTVGLIAGIVVAVNDNHCKKSKSSSNGNDGIPQTFSHSHSH